MDRLLVICPSCQLVAGDNTISSLPAKRRSPHFFHRAMARFFVGTWSTFSATATDLEFDDKKRSLADENQT
jgi:hypothetical protein